MNYLRPDLLEKLAEEYVLGTLTRGARRRFEKLLRLSSAAQNAVAETHRALAPFNGGYTPVAPPESVWRAIRIATYQKAQSSPGWRQYFRSMAQPALTLACGAIFSVLAVHEYPRPFGLEPAAIKLAPSYVGILNDEAGKPVLIASALRHGDVLTIKLLRPLNIPKGKQARLWGMPVGGKPVFVGGISATEKAQTIMLPASAELTFAKTEKLSLTFDRAATPLAPEGPVELQGNCVKIW